MPDSIEIKCNVCGTAWIPPHLGCPKCQDSQKSRELPTHSSTEEEMAHNYALDRARSVDGDTDPQGKSFLQRKLAALWGLRKGRELYELPKVQCDWVAFNKRAELDAEIKRLKAELASNLQVHLIGGANEAKLEDTIASLKKLLGEATSALEFYAGETKDAEWQGAMLMACDKFGGLDEEASGPHVAQEALAKLRASSGPTPKEST